MLRGRPCRLEANTLAAQVSAVLAGLGLGVLPHFMARKNGLHCVNPDPGVDQPLWLVMHSDLAGSRRVRVVADHLIALFDEHKAHLALP
jgi:DNA-binding transcriptional LysR family regulator